MSLYTWWKKLEKTIERWIQDGCTIFLDPFQAFRGILELKYRLYRNCDGKQKCESCGNLFSEEGTLNKHIHTVLEFSKNYKCESCGKLFPHGGKLKRHIKRVHERMNAAQNLQLTKFKCKICKKEITGKHNSKYTWKMIVKN